jgi:hypothetical protein
VALAGAAVLALSPFLSWADFDFEVGTVSKTGMDAGDGWITLVLAAAVAVLVILAWRRPAARQAWAGCALIGLAAGVLTAV